MYAELAFIFLFTLGLTLLVSAPILLGRPTRAEASQIESQVTSWYQRQRSQLHDTIRKQYKAWSTRYRNFRHS